MERVTTGDTRQSIHAVLRQIGRMRITQQDYAVRAGIEPATITRLIHGMRPTESVLRKLVHSWEADRDALDVLCAHLRDEIARAQVGESRISVETPEASGDTSINDDLAVLRRGARDDNELRGLLRNLAVVVGASMRASARLAAESPAVYRVKSEKKKQ
jgi:transcriptional regulator with XRE-family HTH domain